MQFLVGHAVRMAPVLCAYCPTSSGSAEVLRCQRTRIVSERPPSRSRAAALHLFKAGFGQHDENNASSDDFAKRLCRITGCSVEVRHSR